MEEMNKMIVARVKVNMVDGRSLCLAHERLSAMSMARSVDTYVLVK